MFSHTLKNHCLVPYPKIKGVGKDFNKMKPAKSRIDTTFYPKYLSICKIHITFVLKLKNISINVFLDYYERYLNS